MDRSRIVKIVAEEIAASGDKALEQRVDVGRRVAARLSGVDAPTEELAPSWLFVRQTRWCPPRVLRAFGGFLPAIRYLGRPTNRGTAWYKEAANHDAQIAPFDWMPLPGEWRPGLTTAIAFAADNGAMAYCINAEPLHPSKPNRWEGKPDEAQAFAEAARDLCDRHRIELWFSSWARPEARKSFPWQEFIRPAHRCIPQPYRVHGRPGPTYEADVMTQWRDRGAKRFILGRGAHELDHSDNDAWRTQAEIVAHRRTTPPGMVEAWWTPKGTIPAPLVDAMTEPL